MAHNTTACAEKKLWGLTQNKPVCVYVCVCVKKSVSVQALLTPGKLWERRGPSLPTGVQRLAG